MNENRKTSFASTLTVGATGMLDMALHEIASLSTRTLAVSRGASEKVARLGLPSVTALDLDYADADRFMFDLEMVVDLATIDLALLWFHNEGLEALFRLMGHFIGQPIRIVHVAGSAAGNPDRQLEKIGSRISFGPETEFVPVILGAMPEGSGRRWLTHEEICAGTMKAVTTGEPQMIGFPLTHFD